MEGQTQKQQQAAESKENMEERNRVNINTTSWLDHFFENMESKRGEPYVIHLV